MVQPHRLERNINLYYLGEFASALYFIIPVWVAFERQYLTFTQMSLIDGIRQLVVLVSQLPTGAFADIFGRRVSIVIGNIINMIGLFAMAFATTGTAIAAALITRGIGDGFVSGADTALLYDSLKEMGREHEFTKIRGRGVLVNQLGIIIGSVFAGYMYAYWKGLPFVAFGICVLISAGFFALMKEPILDSERFTMRSYGQRMKRGFGELFKSRYITYLSAFYVLVGGITWSWQLYFNQIYASDIGYNEIAKGWLFAVIRFVNAVLIVRMLHLERFISKGRVFIFFPSVMLISSLFTLIPSTPVGTFLLFTMTLASTLRFVLLDSYVNEFFVSKYRATALSALNLLVGVVYTILVIVSGPILDTFTSRVVYVGMGGIIIVAIIPLALLLRKHKPVTVAIEITNA